MWANFLYSSATFSVWLYHKTLGNTDVGPSPGTLVSHMIALAKNTSFQSKEFIKALEFIQITSAGLGTKAEAHYDNSLRIFDRGFWNTICTETPITHM